MSATAPAPDFDLPRLLALKEDVVPLARDLGHWARDFADRARDGDGDLGVSAKTTPGDVVTFADTEVQRRLVTALRELAPGVGFVGEEGLDASTPGAPTWVLDPIDGTHNYVRAYPGFWPSRPARRPTSESSPNWRGARPASARAAPPATTGACWRADGATCSGSSA